MSVTTAQVQDALREGREIALIDLREEGPFARAHPLFAVNIPLSKLDLQIGDLVPRGDAPIVLYDDGEGFVSRAQTVLASLGYSHVDVLEGGLAGWRKAGGEIFIDVNVPSKAFGELVEHERGTPSLPALELQRRLAAGEDIVVLDARRFSEYNAMSIPTGRSVPGGELAYRIRDIAPSPETTVVVNCAGRTRSIIGTQSLINAGIPNPVYALRNGTIGWTLAGLKVERGASQKGAAATEAGVAITRETARSLAERSGVEVLTPKAFAALQANRTITIYRLDVRSPEEYAVNHLTGFRSAPGGQLIQATDEWIGVRHGTVVLADDDGVRARMAAHWLRQLGWRAVFVLDRWDDLAQESGDDAPNFVRVPPTVETIEPDALLAKGKSVLIVDLAPSPTHRKGHVPGAVFAVRADLATHSALRARHEIVLTSPDGILATFAAPELAATGVHVRVLAGGTQAWQRAGLRLEDGLDSERAISLVDDVYKRPYEGTDNAEAAMQAYLDWEYGLIAQLERDGTHGFQVLPAA